MTTKNKGNRHAAKPADAKLSAVLHIRCRPEEKAAFDAAVGERVKAKCGREAIAEWVARQSDNLTPT